MLEIKKNITNNVKVKRFSSPERNYLISPRIYIINMQTLINKYNRTVPNIMYNTSLQESLYTGLQFHYNVKEIYLMYYYYITT